MRRKKLSKASEIVERELRGSDLDVVVLDKDRVELRGHNRSNKNGAAFIFYGVLPLVASVYFWYKEQLIIVLSCLTLGLLVLGLRAMSRSNTKDSYLLMDKRSGRLHYNNAGEEGILEGLDIIQSIHSKVIELRSGSFHRTYIAYVSVRTSDGYKITVAQFEASTDYFPTSKAKALGQFLGCFLDKPYEHKALVRTG